MGRVDPFPNALVSSSDAGITSYQEEIYRRNQQYYEKGAERLKRLSAYPKISLGYFATGIRYPINGSYL
jgi:hypothetical protein